MCPRKPRQEAIEVKGWTWKGAWGYSVDWLACRLEGSLRTECGEARRAGKNCGTWNKATACQEIQGLLSYSNLSPSKEVTHLQYLRPFLSMHFTSPPS